MRLSKKTIASIAIVVVMGAVATIGLGAYAVKTVLAQTAPTQTPNAQAPSTGTNYENLFLQNLAQQLGTTVDKLKAAITAAANSVIDQAQTDGKITQSQADQLKQKAANGGFPGPFFFRGKGMHGDFEFGEHMGKGMVGAGVQEFADALGMTPQDLMTELRAGKSIADVATEKNVDLQQVITKVLAAAKAKLDTAVTNQQLTQAQADQIYQNLSNNINTIVQQKGFMGRGGMHGGWKNFNQNPQQQQPSTTPGAGA